MRPAHLHVGPNRGHLPVQLDEPSGPSLSHRRATHGRWALGRTGLADPAKCHQLHPKPTHPTERADPPNRGLDRLRRPKHLHRGADARPGARFDSEAAERARPRGEFRRVWDLVQPLQRRHQRRGLQHDPQGGAQRLHHERPRVRRRVERGLGSPKPNPQRRLVH